MANKNPVVSAKNRKALRNYTFVTKFIAGIKLHGYEVKAIREGKANLEGSYVLVEDGQAQVFNLFIGKYSKYGESYSDQQARRARQLLLTADEIEKIRRSLQQKGKAAVPLSLLLQHNLVKLEVGIGVHAKKLDKKAVEKEQQKEREIDREIKEHVRTL